MSAFLSEYPELIACVVAWSVSSLLKIPIYFFTHKKLQFSLAFSTGGMPSSHAATLTGTTLAIGLFDGFNSPVFALAVATSMIVIYDASGVRREAGYHAETLNLLIEEFFKGTTVDQKKLKEMLGHTPVQVVGGVLTGLFTSLILWLIWPK